MGCAILGTNATARLPLQLEVTLDCGLRRSSLWIKVRLIVILSLIVCPYVRYLAHSIMNVHVGFNTTFSNQHLKPRSAIDCHEIPESKESADEEDKSDREIFDDDFYQRCRASWSTAG